MQNGSRWRHRGRCRHSKHKQKETVGIAPDCTVALPQLPAKEADLQAELEPTGITYSEGLLDMAIGNPLVYEDFWEKLNHYISLPLSRKMGYDLVGLPSLHEAILAYHRELSKIWSPLNPAAYPGGLIIGNGSTQLLVGTLISIWALEFGFDPLSAMDTGSATGVCYVLVENPYYFYYRSTFEAAFPGRFIFQCTQDKIPAGAVTIELITSPNNPNGVLAKPASGFKSKYCVADTVYDCPAFGKVPQHVDWADVRLFSGSKAMGFASSRVGWCFVKQKRLADLITNYVSQSTLGLSETGMLRVLAGFQYVIPNIKFFYDNMRAIMQCRWNTFLKLVAQQKVVQAQNDFGPYLWLRAPGHDAEKLFRGMGILGVAGIGFLLTCPEAPDSASYIRLNGICNAANWTEFIRLFRQALPELQ
jgi:hypothetical protein